MSGETENIEHILFRCIDPIQVSGETEEDRVRVALSDVVDYDIVRKTRKRLSNWDRTTIR